MYRNAISITIEHTRSVSSSAIPLPDAFKITIMIADTTMVPIVRKKDSIKIEIGFSPDQTTPISSAQQSSAQQLTRSESSLLPVRPVRIGIIPDLGWR